MKSIFRMLKSTRLAVSLILILAVLCLIGILLPQIPAEFSATPDGYAWWVENIAYRQVGDSCYTLEALGLFEVFRSGWFICATVLLILNILACIIPRIRSIQRESKKTGVKSDEDFYRQGKYVFAFDISSAQKRLCETAERALDDRHYSAIREEAPGAVYFAGEKRGLSKWATLFVHLSLILLLTGVLIGSLSGFRNSSFVVVEGETKAVGNGTGLSVYLDSFSDEYWEDGTPKDYRSDVAIYQNNEEVKSGIVRVNHPLTVHGVSFHQGSFGEAVMLRMLDADGNVAFQQSIPLTEYQTNDDFIRPKGAVSLPQNDYNIVLLGSAVNGTDPYIGTDQIGVEFYDENLNFIGWLVLDHDTPQQLGDLQIQYSRLQYSGFLVSKDPGGPFIWTAAGLFLLGLGMIFYFPYRRIWIRTSAISEHETRVMLRIDGQKSLGLENEARILLKELGLLEEPEESNVGH
ncbi:MAG: cytochrome c biogenesis protein ResB [Clostridiales bacterium]|nr:cytochrome c biogenesis protein ResB [Clostridiales bacterium]